MYSRKNTGIALHLAMRHEEQWTTVVGYKDARGRIKQIRSPFDVGTEVLKAEEEFIKSVVMIEDQEKEHT